MVRSMPWRVGLGCEVSQVKSPTRVMAGSPANAAGSGASAGDSPSSRKSCRRPSPTCARLSCVMVIGSWNSGIRSWLKSVSEVKALAAVSWCPVRT